MKKLAGYIFASIGVAALAVWAIPASREAIPGSSIITDTILLIIAAVGILLGAFSLYGKKKSKQPSEVPIYQGKNIVGYRQH